MIIIFAKQKHEYVFPFFLQKWEHTLCTMNPTSFSPLIYSVFFNLLGAWSSKITQNSEISRNHGRGRGEAFSHHLHLAPKFSPPGGNTRGPGCLPIPCPEGLASSLPARSHQLSYYLSRHKPNYRPCPKGAVGFMGRVRRQRQAGVKPCPPTHTLPCLSLWNSSPSTQTSPCHLFLATTMVLEYFLCF